MPYLLVGAGQAGSAIVDEVFEHKNMSKIAHPIVFNSTIRDLQNLSNIDSDNWYGIAQQHGLVEGGTSGFEERVTGGFGRDPVSADEVMAQHSHELFDALDEQLGRASADEFDPESGADVPFAFVFVGLGGGTGCGISPYIADAIRNYTDGVAEIIAVCVLPNTQGPVGQSDEDEKATPSRQAWNARYGLDRIEQAADGIILVDNQRLAYHDAAEGQFTEYNEFIASGIVDLISGPILERIDRSDYDVDPPIIDLQDVITSLSFGGPGGDTDPGYASLCRSVMMTKSLSGYLLPFVGKKELAATDLWDRAQLKQSLEGVDLDDTEKAIGLLRAPSRYIRDDTYRIDTSKFRSTLTAYCNEVNLGVTLTNRNLASFTALLTYRREDVSRIAEIASLAEEYEEQSGFEEAPSKFEPTTSPEAGRADRQAEWDPSTGEGEPAGARPPERGRAANPQQASGGPERGEGPPGGSGQGTRAPGGPEQGERAPGGPEQGERAPGSPQQPQKGQQAGQRPPAGNQPNDQQPRGQPQEGRPPQGGPPPRGQPETGQPRDGQGAGPNRGPRDQRQQGPENGRPPQGTDQDSRREPRGTADEPRGNREPARGGREPEGVSQPDEQSTEEERDSQQ